MARQPRFILPGEPQHVIQRGNNRDRIFIKDEDYRFYIEKLNEACNRFGCQVHAYVLMTNHVHLLITPEDKDGISLVMQSLGRVYVRYFNDLYHRTGTLWEGRYRATLIDSAAYLLTCYIYIEKNPVRAAMVEHPAEYKWSSYHGNGSGLYDPLITPHELYLHMGKDPESRRERYRTLFRLPIPDSTLDEIRDATNKAWALGNDKFRKRVEVYLDRPVGPRPRGGDRKSKQFRAETRINRV